MLQKGDVIKIENGMHVSTKAPDKFFYGNCRFSNKLNKHIVIVGDVKTITAQNQIDAIESIAHRIVEAFDREGAKVSILDAKVVANELAPTPQTEQWTITAGEFVVIDTKKDGGSGGYTHSHDYYPDGHHVFLKRLNEDGSYNPEGDEVDFFQSGSFTHTITGEIPVIRKMTVTVTTTYV